MSRAGWVLRRGLRAYPSSPSADSTRTRVSAATSARPLSTFDTVGTETSAAAAMAAIVTRFCAALIGSLRSPDAATPRLELSAIFASYSV
jgi:hypothetical protein